MEKLTELEMKIYEYIKAFINEHSYSPTYGEIAAACYVSKTVVFFYIERLCDKGYIAKENHKGRTIRILI